MKVITFFNNKGGVGKTTLATNVASYLKNNFEKRVLFVDADPQSNSTQAMVDEDRRYELYLEDSKYKTLLDVLKPILLGESGINTNNPPFPAEENRFKMDFIPGHPKLSLIEDRLSESWNACKSGDLGGFRKTNWVKALSDSVSDVYEYIIFDVGPSLGALNRSILLNTDYFLTPMGCDVFSLMGIENIAEWINGWKSTYELSYLHLKSNFRPVEIEAYPIRTDISNMFRFAGYSVQQYITKVIGGKRRGIKAYETVKEQIPKYIADHFSSLLPHGVSLDKTDLGYIPNVYSLVPLAQTQNCPIHGLKRSDGIVGNQYTLVTAYVEEIDNLCKKLIRNTGGTL